MYYGLPTKQLYTYIYMCVCVYFVNQAWGQDGGILDQDELEVHKNKKIALY